VDPHWFRPAGCGSGSRRAKSPTKIEKVKEFHVLKYWMFSLVAKGFSYILDVLHGGLGINELQFFISNPELFLIG
jgi:hypothetical protein